MELLNVRSSLSVRQNFSMTRPVSGSDSRASCVLTEVNCLFTRFWTCDTVGLIWDQWSCWLSLHFHKSLHTLNWQISKWDSECGALRCVKMGVFWKQHGGNMMFLQNYNHSVFFWPRATRTANPGNRPRPPWRQKRRSDIRSLLSSEVSPGRGEEPTADRQLPEAPPPAGVEQHSPVVACTWLSGQTGTVHMWLWWWETGDFWCVDKFMMDFFTIKTLLNDLCGLFSF